MARDPETMAHQEWLGFVQPVGLVASIPALLQAQAHINKNIAPDHQRFLDCLPEDEDAEPVIKDFPGFTQTVLGWETTDLVGANGTTLPDSLEVTLPEYNETLRPTYAVAEFDLDGKHDRWIMLIKTLLPGTDLDEVAVDSERLWQATPHARFERLLRETEVPIGLLFDGRELRLVYAPRGETSGHITFRVSEMAQVAGRPIFAALKMLLCCERVFGIGMAEPEKTNLAAILADSRKYQNVVSTKLAEQVLAALYEFLRGFQAADDQRKGELLREVLEDDPNHVYAGLLTTLLRLVFTLYAEDRGLLSNDSVYVNHYSVTGLFDRLRADAGRFPDTIDQRFGAWAQLLVLFRIIHDGGSHGKLRIPGRKGYLFDPDRYPFLEGRPKGSHRDTYEKLDVPRVSDGVIYRVLNNLLILDGERLSYRTLDVEQIGSVYETIMGLNLEVATGPSIAIKPAKSHGAPTTIDLEQLLAAKPADRTKWVRETTDQKLTPKAAEPLTQARTIDDLLAALEKKIARKATPNIVPKGAMVLQPSDERRRSGSHYTPRSLTEPIVRKTLEPILKRLSDRPTPEQILDLKVCDLAMGSGAFLVEACRQLGDALVKAWYDHDCLPSISPDEDELLHARRIIAQRCLYGVDKNPMAVDLAKLSLWLATLAKDHPFTFLDHALRCGDSLVGLTRQQIADFHWQPVKQRALGQEHIDDRIKRATEYRAKILAARDDVPYEQLRQELDLADEALEFVRFGADLCVAAFFAAKKDKDRTARRDEYLALLTEYFQSGDPRKRPTAQVGALRRGEHAITPFHWEIEYPEVFGPSGGGFDAFVGNPPFLGGRRIRSTLGDAFCDWLTATNDDLSLNADLVAVFFRKAYESLAEDGTFGLIATNSIAQGDTRRSGLRWICLNGGAIYHAVTRLKWPGTAAVIVSTVNVVKGDIASYQLDGRQVERISAYLFHTGGDEDPFVLAANLGIAYQGVVVAGSGFLFDDANADASSDAEMRKLIDRSPRNAERIFPYIGGEELNDSPTLSYSRWVISFGDMSEDEARSWPDLMSIIETKVRPYRAKVNRDAHRKYWWHFGDKRPEMMRKLDDYERVLVNAQVTGNFAFAFQPTDRVFAMMLNVFILDSWVAFCVMQSRTHETWARFLGSSMKDDLRYTPSDCFETFPFPEGFQAAPRLELAGKEYYEFRAALMVRNNEGLTKTYNRFHDPHEKSAEVLKLRELHDAMDREVLKAYKWIDLQPMYEFLLDYEEEEDESGPGKKPRKKKKPWRYRWPDDFRDEVLARLLDLNQKRADEERLAGRAGESKRATTTGRRSENPKAKRARHHKQQARLFEG